MIDSRYIIILTVLLFEVAAASGQGITYGDIYGQIRTGHLNDAANLLEKYIIQNPDSLGAHMLLGKVYMAIGGPNARTAAERVFRAGLRRDMHNAGLLRLLADVKENQEMPELSIRWLERAVDSDPSHQATVNKLLEEYIRQGSERKVEKLRGLVEQALTDNPENALSYLALGKLETTLDRPEQAIPILEKGIKIDPDNPLLHKALSEAHLFDGNGDNGTKEYFRWLELETDAKLLSEEYAISELVMSPGEIEDFRQSTDKKSYILHFWKKMDPYIISEMNERLVEHLFGVLYAKIAFHTVQGMYGFDDRGKVYIRWGEPEERGRNIMVDGAREAESWYYPSYGLYMAFDFVDLSGGYFHEVPSLLDAVWGGWDRNATGYLLYNRIADLGGIYSILASRPLDQLSFEVMEYAREKQSAKFRILPRNEIELDMPELEFSHRITQFRGDSGRTRLELAYGIPLDQMTLSPEKPDTIRLLFYADFAMLDSIYDRYLHVQTGNTCACPPGLDYSRVHFLDELREGAKPGRYSMAFQIHEFNTGRAEFSTSPLAVRDFTGDALMMSDIKISRFLHVLSQGNESNPEEIYVEPYPFARIGRSARMYLYFELYNLFLEPAGGTKYRVAVAVESRRDAGDYLTLPVNVLRNIVSPGGVRMIESEYMREGTGRTTAEYLELDLSRIERGPVRITVTVHDMIGGDKTNGAIELELEQKAMGD